jgi:hypothetical protein
LHFSPPAGVSGLEHLQWYLWFAFHAIGAFVTGRSGPSALYAGFQDLRTGLGEIAEGTSGDMLHETVYAYVQWPTKMDQLSNIEALGQVLYTYYFYFFLVASVILLVAMIGAIVLTMHKGVFVKRQEVYEQNTREFTKTIHKIRS